MNKLLTVAVPAYNSESYLSHCLETLESGGERLEVIIVNDGSTDQTAAIAQRFVDRSPHIFKLVNKENGGHGSGVNKGLELATGEFYRVVDSDDWVDEEALTSVLNFIEAVQGTSNEPDMLITNYVYEYAYNGTRRRITFKNVFGQEGILSAWSDLGFFRVDQVFVMHSLTYRTSILRECGLKLPEHCFYVDNLYDYIPLPWVEAITWLDVDLYHYFVGRDDQSVHTPNMIKRIDQQLKVTSIMMKAYHLEEDIPDNYKRNYMYRLLSTIVVISQIHLNLANTREAELKNQKMWQELKEFDPVMYRKIRNRFLSVMTNLPGKLGRFIERKGFFIAQKIFKFS